MPEGQTFEQFAAGNRAGQIGFGEDEVAAAPKPVLTMLPPSGGDGKAPVAPPPPSDASLLADAWAVIANVSGGDWSQQPPMWRMAAERWRDQWHESQAKKA